MYLFQRHGGLNFVQPAEKRQKMSNIQHWGRPKGSSILAPLLRILAEDRNEHGEGRLAEMIAQAIVSRAVNGDDISGLLKLVERIDGAVIKRMEHSIQSDRTVVVHAAEFVEIPRLPGTEEANLLTMSEMAAECNREERVVTTPTPTWHIVEGESSTSQLENKSVLPS
jgi:hypothetical protein